MVADGSEPPIDKPCGEGLMPETQAALRDLGISAEELGGYAVRGLRFVQRDDQVAAAFPTGRGIGIRRTVLHELLVKRARDCGVEFLWNTPVSGIFPDAVQTSRGLIEAKWIVGADGSGSRVRRWCGLDASHGRSLRHATRRHYLVTPWTEFVEVYWGERCQAYVTPISSQEVCIVLTAAEARDTHFDDALRNWPQLQERLAGAELTSRERGAVTFMHRLRHVVRGNVALVGDSFGRRGCNYRRRPSTLLSTGACTRRGDGSRRFAFLRTRAQKAGAAPYSHGPIDSNAGQERYAARTRHPQHGCETGNIWQAAGDSRWAVDAGKSGFGRVAAWLAVPGDVEE